jgi:UPF0716 protein FxsA
MRLLLFPTVLLLWPLAEIAGFVVVGRWIGIWGTLALVIGTAIAGGYVLRLQGMHMLRQLSATSREGALPGRDLVDGAMIVVAGILLLLPGLITDVLGVLLFIPPVRRAIWSGIGRRILVVRTSREEAAWTNRDEPQQDRAAGPLIDLDEQDYRRNTRSPWTKRNQNED